MRCLDPQYASAIVHKMLDNISHGDCQRFDVQKVLDEMTNTKDANLDDGFRLRLTESAAAHYLYFTRLKEAVQFLEDKNTPSKIFERAANMIESFCTLVAKEQERICTRGSRDVHGRQ